MMRSQPATRPRSSSRFPGVMSRAFRSAISGAGSVLAMRSTAPRAMALRSFEPGLTMSSSTTFTPALAMCAAMPLPITPAPITAADWIAMAASSDRFQHGGDALPAADALGRERQALALPLEKSRGLAGDARAGGTQRMADGDGAAVQVHLRRIDLEVAQAGDRLRGEGLVDLDEVDLVDRYAGALQRLAAGRHRTDPHDLRRAAGDGDRADAGERLQPMLFRERLGADERRRGPIGQRRRGSGGDASGLLEGRLEPGKRFRGRLG